MFRPASLISFGPATLRRMALGAALLVAACGNPAANLQPLPETTASAYKLGAGDQLRVTVFNDPRLSGDFRISDAGNVALPLVGAIPVTGRTTTEAERAIERSLRSRNLFNDPSVAVEVQEYRPIFVLGMVERGGQTPYQPGMTVLSAVAVAGGFNYRAITDTVSITRVNANGVAEEYRAGRDALLMPGDVVTVFERRF
ncbi:polysaccharide biosynthesis/export family protein [Teichococcus oryzae]|jgi:polysaccharide export outer membrane protein|uniref:Polysaccharide export protein n=1 Tax=Teichococcus oryzae TaxID=1608942 RepID=A0A5B2TCW8_9PROT|nr:polysaccharide biosynthesis/export family protein [Pseudoroseomonas oryzae]KAA2211915.1 polysaccharide export protein [Pseudoroseomonas oryzae]